MATSKLRSASLTLNNGEWGLVRIKLNYGENHFDGYVTFGTDEMLIKKAAHDGSATIGLAPNLFLPVSVGGYKRGRAPINGSAPHPAAPEYSYSQPAYSCSAEGDFVRNTVILEINSDHFVLLADQARGLARQLLKSAKVSV